MNATPNKSKQSFQENSSDWPKAIQDVTEKFLAYRAMPPCRERERKRERFYGEILKLSRSAALATLRAWSWPGDCHHDYQEIASSCVKKLLQQEVEGRGLFSKKERSSSQLRGYLSSTIWRGVKQRALDLFRKEHRFCFLDERKLSIRDSGESWHLVEELSEAASNQGKYRTPAGITPLDAVIDKALGIAAEKYHEEAGVAKRTWQRREAAARELLRRELLNSSIWTSGRRDARRINTTNRDVEC